METRHPTQRSYVLVFVGLTVLTVIEVAASYLPEPRAPLLIPLALAKAALVALFFMHLKYDRRAYGAMFVLGLLMGTSLIVALSLLLAPYLTNR